MTVSIRRRPRLLALAAGALAFSAPLLAGCSGPAGAAGRAPAPEPEAVRYSPEQIGAALTAVNASEGLSGQILGQEDLGRSAGDIAAGLGTMSFDPAECAQFAVTDVSKVLEAANLGHLAAISRSPESTVLVAVASGTKGSEIPQAKADRDVVERCRTVAITQGGKRSNLTVQPRPALVEGAEASAITTLSDYTGVMAHQAVVEASTGATRVTVTHGIRAGAEDAAIDRAEAIAAAVLKALEVQP